MTAAREKPQQRIDFEHWYSMNAFDYHRDPIGSRDCSLQWVAWQAAQESQLAALAAKDEENAKQAAEIDTLRSLVAMDQHALKAETSVRDEKIGLLEAEIEKERNDTLIALRVLANTKKECEQQAVEIERLQACTESDARVIMDFIEQNNKQAAEIERLNKEHRQTCDEQEALLGEYVAKIEQLQAIVSMYIQDTGYKYDDEAITRYKINHPRG